MTDEPHKFKHDSLENFPAYQDELRTWVKAEALANPEETAKALMERLLKDQRGKANPMTIHDIILEVRGLL